DRPRARSGRAGGIHPAQDHQHGALTRPPRTIFKGNGLATMEVTTTSPEIENTLVTAACWADEQGIHEQLRWLRNNDPLRWLEPPGFEPFWSVTKYNDIKEIEGKKTIFLNDPRPTLANKGTMEAIQALTGRRHLVRS